jgi:cation diffusion facilitator CzcD-associated flavoprotein CzcO
MGIQLSRAGFDDFVILEKSGSVGGTWNHNRYPGCACDIPSYLYSYSFEIKRDWSRPYAPQPEILAYLEHCADKYGLRPHCRFDEAVQRAVWDEGAARWTLELASGERIEADVVVSAVGMFNELFTPEIEGLDAFAGTCFHSARWNTEHDLTGETVGVIGSAASAIQFVPEIVKQAGQVYLFQRTANWVLPKADEPFPEPELERLRNEPHAAEQLRQEIFNGIDSAGAGAFAGIRSEMEEACRSNMEQVDDPALRARLLPDHPWACKRPLLSSDYYSAFNRPNLELVTDGIDRIAPGGVVTVDGVERPVDTLILATGFEATKFLSSIDVVGRGGVRIAEAWRDGAEAYKGVMTTGFPNLFMLYGPNTNADSLITTIEFEAEYAVRQIQRLVAEDLAWIDVRPEYQAEYNAKLQQDIANIEPWQAGCSDYYRAPSGRIVTQWPRRMSEFKQVLETPDLDAYEVAPREPSSG